MVCQSLLPGRAPVHMAGNRPALTIEDLPLPEGPTTARKRLPASRAASSATSASRPKKNSASSGSNAARPLYGHARPAGPRSAMGSASISSPVPARYIDSASAASTCWRCSRRLILTNCCRCKSSCSRWSANWSAWSTRTSASISRTLVNIQRNSENWLPRLARPWARASRMPAVDAARAASTPPTACNSRLVSLRKARAVSSAACQWASNPVSSIKAMVASGSPTWRLSCRRRAKWATRSGKAVVPRSYSTPRLFSRAADEGARSPWSVGSRRALVNRMASRSGLRSAYSCPCWRMWSSIARPDREQGGGKSTSARSGWRSWKICSGSLTFLNRCRPRSRSVAFSGRGQVWVTAGVSRICPPHAADTTRAAQLTAGP